MAPLRRQQTIEAIRHRVAIGEWLSGTRIPTELELSRLFGVSRCTVRGALEALIEAGEIERRMNVGCFVASGSGGDSFRSGLIAYLESNTSGNLSGNLLLRGAELQAFDYGIDMIYCNLNGHMEKAQEFIDRLCRRGCRNILFAPEICRNYCEVNNPVLDAFEAAALNWVVVSSPLLRDGMIRGDFVGSDNYGVMRNMVRQLVQAGHRRIGSIRVFSGVFSSDQRLAGILDQLRLEGLPAAPEYHLAILDVPLEEQGREQLRQLMKLPEPPSAIICIHDAIAANAIDELRRMGKTVPRDVSICGFDDSFLAQTIQLTSVRQPFTEVGKRAVRLLYEKRFGGETGRHQEFLPCRIVNRKSLSTLY